MVESAISRFNRSPNRKHPSDVSLRVDIENSLSNVDVATAVLLVDANSNKPTRRYLSGNASTAINEVLLSDGGTADINMAISQAIEAGSEH